MTMKTDTEMRVSINDESYWTEQDLLPCTETELKSGNNNLFYSSHST